MAKNRISAQDFLDLMDEESEPQMAAFRPTLARKSEPSSIQAARLDNVDEALSAPKKDRKLGTNQEQSGNKLGSQPGTNQEQSGNSHDAHPELTGNKLGSQLGTVPGTKWEQTRDKVGTPQQITAVVGIQRKILDFLFANAQSLGSRTTGKIHPEVLSEKLGCSIDTVRTSIKRLKKKGLIICHEFKNGRGGFSILEITADAYQNLFIGNKLGTNQEQSGNKLGSQPGTQLGTSVPCSSSIINNNNTTTTEPEMWLNVPKNLSGLVSLKQLREFVRQGIITEDILQNSLDAFAFDLENGNVRSKTGNPISILIGALKNGGYISHAFSAAVQKELEEIKKRLVESQKKNEEMAALKLELEFEEFREKNPVEAEAFKPALFSSHERGSVGYRMWMDEYRSKKTPRNPLEG